MVAFRLHIASVAFWLAGTGFAVFGQTTVHTQQLHTRALDEANTAVKRARSRAENDSLRPIYHVTAAARFINDPNGPVYFAGKYHVFFQHLPFWGDSLNNRPVWGHAVSTDLVHWRHLPIALAPTPGTYDADAIASGCCVIQEGIPTIIYTGVGPRQTQCLAMSHDSLRTWIKDIANPVISSPPSLEGLRDGFRDPCAWREGDKWRMLVGSAFQGKGGTVLLYQSHDLHHWEFLGPLCTGMGDRCIQWECPAFFPLGDKHVLIVSPLYSDQPGLRGMVEYSTGKYNNNRFESVHWEPVDLGGPSVFYAPNSFEDERGRRILWGWIMAARPPQAGWWGSLSLPRVVSIATDSTLRFAPLPELKLLRFDEQIQKSFFIRPDQEFIVRPGLGMHYEMLVEAEVNKSSQFELRIGPAKMTTTKANSIACVT
jgi:beta-fructofuranosidase